MTKPRRGTNPPARDTPPISSLVPVAGPKGLASTLETLFDMVPVGILTMPDIRKPGEISVNRYGGTLVGAPQGGTRASLRTIRLFRAGRELTLDENPLRVAARSGQPVPIFEAQLVRADESRVDILMSAMPVFGDDGTVRGGIAAIFDISERKQAEARQQVLLYELQHRVKNIIATISALASRTLRRDDASAEAFVGRLRGMATTHELLSRGNWTEAPLRDLVEGAVTGHVPAAAGRVSIEGPPVVMASNAAATLGMVFYELATNAVKYGALAHAKGSIDVSWRLARESEERVILTWTEIGSQPPKADAVAGFGTHFVRRSVEYELQGKATLEPMRAGLRWRLEFPSERNLQRP